MREKTEGNQFNVAGVRSSSSRRPDLGLKYSSAAPLKRQPEGRTDLGILYIFMEKFVSPTVLNRVEGGMSGLFCTKGPVPAVMQNHGLKYKYWLFGVE